MNVHGEPIIPKEKEIDFNDIELPKFFDDLVGKKKRPLKKNLAKSVRPSSVPQAIKEPQNPDSFMYIADIQENSDLNLYLDELHEVRGIYASKKLPERLVFVYKGNVERQWPIYRILEESYSTLTKVFSAMKKTTGYTPEAKIMVLNKITEIRKSWASEDSLPRKLKIPFTGNRIHHQPYWMMEFRDENGCRRFFRMEDQLKKADNKTLKFLQTKLDPTDERRRNIL